MGNKAQVVEKWSQLREQVLKTLLKNVQPVTACPGYPGGNLKDFPAVSPHLIACAG